MDKKQINYFLEIVNNDCSFTKTAQTAYVSQASLSQHMKRLSEELGVRLFNTSRKNAAKLTPGGKILFTFFSGFAENLNNAIYDAKKANQAPQGKLNIVSIEGWDTDLLVSIKNSFAAAYPNINIFFTAMGCRMVEKGIRDGSFDIAFTSAGQIRYLENVCSKFLTKIPCILLFSAKHPLAGKSDLTVLDFKDEVFYTFQSKNTLLPEEVTINFCKNMGFLPYTVELPNLESIILAVGQGQGFTILDSWVRIKSNPDFKYITLKTDITVCALWKKSNSNPALDIMVNDFLQKTPAFASPEEITSSHVL